MPTLVLDRPYEAEEIELANKIAALWTNNRTMGNRLAIMRLGRGPLMRFVNEVSVSGTVRDFASSVRIPVGDLTRAHILGIANALLFSQEHNETIVRMERACTLSSEGEFFHDDCDCEMVPVGHPVVTMSGFVEQTGRLPVPDDSVEVMCPSGGWMNLSVTTTPCIDSYVYRMTSEAKIVIHDLAE